MTSAQLYQILAHNARGTPLGDWLVARERVVLAVLDQWLTALVVVADKPKRPKRDTSTLTPIQAILSTRTSDDARDVIRSLAELTAEMLGRGAPVERDDAGFNAGDYSFFRQYFSVLRVAPDPLEIPTAYHIEAARNLIKYGDTQLDGIAARVADVKILEDYAAGRGEMIFPVGTRLRDPHRVEAQGLALAWNDGAVTDKGQRTGGADRFRIGATGRGFDLKAFMSRAGLERGKDWNFAQIGNVWYVEMGIEHLAKVAETLRQLGKVELAEALLVNAPLWEAQAGATAAQKVQVTRALQAEKELATAKATRELETHLASPELYTRAQTIAERLQRMAAAPLRKDEAYLKEAVRVVAYFLTTGDVAPGQERASVKYKNGGQGSFEVRQEAGTEAVRIEVPKGLAPGKWWHAVPGARPAYDDARNYAGFHVTVGMNNILATSRQFDEVNLPLALALRYALLTDTVARECVELEVLSTAGYFEDIHDPTLRAKVQQAASNIPVAPGIVLAPYQQIGVVYATLTAFKCLIGDAMGLGKTVQAISCLSLAPAELVPAVVVAPSSVTYNWQREFHKFAPWFNVVMVQNKGALPRPTGKTVYVVSWDSLHALWDELVGLGVKCAIFDESQKAKNPTARRTKAMLALAEAIPHRLLLSGTPMENSPAELWPQLRAVDPDEFGGQSDFIARYTHARQQTVRVKKPDGSFVNRTFTKPEGGQNLDELADRLRCFMVRRLKDNVLKDLPPKRIVPLWVDLPKDSRALYEKVERDMIDVVSAAYRLRGAVDAARDILAAAKKGQTASNVMDAAIQKANDAAPDNEIAQMVLVQLGYLRRTVGQVKIPLAVEWLSDFWEGQPGAPLVIFVEHLPVLQALGSALTAMGKSWTFIDGSVPAKERDVRVQGFQAGQYDVIIGTGAMYAGVTLTRAQNMLFVERWWVPTREEQAEDRIHRRGQAGSVTINYLMATGTVDERLAEVVDKKRDIIKNVMGAETTIHEAGESTGLTGGADVSQSVARAMIGTVLGKIAGAGEVTKQDVKTALEVLIAGQDPMRVLEFDVRGKLVKR